MTDGAAPKRENAFEHGRTSGVHEVVAPEGFYEPQWDAPLDTEQRLASVPEGHVVKGWLIQSVITGARERGVSLAAGRYTGFIDYPVAEYVRLLAEVATRLRPQTPRRALRELGGRVFSAFASSMIGRVAIGAIGLGGDVEADVFSAIARSYALTSRGGARAERIDTDAHHSLLRLTGVWSFPAAYHVGLFEGAARGFAQREVRVWVRERSACDVDLWLKWADGAGPLRR